jgi:hypothetical protein
MKRLSFVGVFCVLAGCLVASRGPAAEPVFAAPVRLTADGVAVRVEEPGYACPCWADIDQDGDKDLLVGQFRGGKIRVYKNSGQGELASGEWLMAGGEVAEVPGVW